MADTVNIQYIYPPNHDGGANPVPTRKVVVNMTGTCDGTGETDVIKVRLTDLMKHGGATPTRTAVEKITYTIFGEIVQLEWDRAAHAPIARLSPGEATMDFRTEGGKVDPGESGDRTGNIILTTVGGDSGDSYDITLTVRLK